MFSPAVERAPPARSLPEEVTLPHWLTAATALAVRTAVARGLAEGRTTEAAWAEAAALVLARHPALPLPLIRDGVEAVLRAV
jgi:hypothetical protein